MSKKFIVEICSDLDYEEMVADISYEKNLVATISQENGPDKMEIKIVPPGSKTYWNFSLNDFIEIIEFAKKRLQMFKKKD